MKTVTIALALALLAGIAGDAQAAGKRPCPTLQINAVVELEATPLGGPVAELGKLGNLAFRFLCARDGVDFRTILEIENISREPIEFRREIGQSSLLAPGGVTAWVYKEVPFPAPLIYASAETAHVFTEDELLEQRAAFYVREYSLVIVHWLDYCQLGGSIAMIKAASR
jgi:hypothetical protein